MFPSDFRLARGREAHDDELSKNQKGARKNILQLFVKGDTYVVLTTSGSAKHTISEFIVARV